MKKREERRVTTYKQIQAFYWIVKLGSFEAAARKLSVSQSAISKRIQELEDVSSGPLFDRSRRSSTLTPRGELLLAACEEALRAQEGIAEVLGGESESKRRLRLGVTEISALTWLPRLVSRMGERDPSLEIEPYVNSTRVLLSGLERGMVDMIVVPDASRSPEFAAVSVGSVKNAWMCSSNMTSVPSTTIPLGTLSQWPILTQHPLSGYVKYYERWFQDYQIPPSQHLASNSLVAMIGLTLAGLGVGHLPLEMLRPLLKSGRLRQVHTAPELPDLPYVVMFPAGSGGGFEARILQDISETCAFDEATVSFS